MANKNKATHSGHCQICGSLQKLPNGVLAKHGYTKQFGFFNGTCTGSGHKPYELSCDKITGVVNYVKSKISILHKDMEALQLNPVILSEVPFLQYRPRHEGGPVEMLVSVYRDANNQNVINNGGKITPAIRYSLYGTPQEIAEKLVKARIGRLRAQINEQQQYVDWAASRIENWVLSPEKLVPLTMEGHLERLNQGVGVQ